MRLATFTAKPLTYIEADVGASFTEPIDDSQIRHAFAHEWFAAGGAYPFSVVVDVLSRVNFRQGIRWRMGRKGIAAISGGYQYCNSVTPFLSAGHSNELRVS